ncbi:MAG TPA: type II toxin-antitoxin system PemK/MazF family toxin [Methanothrix soehngenii]|nr:type II toxin-antitoxin system PemK/MazF family toxin [Methanothrix soehngenii]
MSGEPPKTPKGCIILAWFPYTDFSDEKLRPALVLCEGYLDVTVAYISGQIPAKPLPSDLLILPGTSSYTNAGLKEPSVLSIDKIMIIDKTKSAGIIGLADNDLKRKVNGKISDCLMFNDIPVI